MANHGWTILPKGKKTSPEEITSHIWFLDRQRFDGEIGHMRSYTPTSHKDPYFWELPMSTKKGDVIFSLQFFLHPRGRKFEWRHPPDPMIGWWLQQYIAEYIAYKLGGLVHDDGISEKCKPNFFMKYPIVQDWVGLLTDIPKVKKIKTMASKLFMQDLEKNVPEGLWKVVSQTNGFEKQFDILSKE